MVRGVLHWSFGSLPFDVCKEGFLCIQDEMVTDTQAYSLGLAEHSKGPEDGPKDEDSDQNFKDGFHQASTFFWAWLAAEVFIPDAPTLATWCSSFL